MSEVNVIIRTADQTRKAEVSLDPTNTGADVIQASVDQWSLPTDTDYRVITILKTVMYWKFNLYL
jgi:hypothetical protein